MALTTVTVVLQRAARLIPGATSTHLATNSVGCCTPAATLPERFRGGQREHTLSYMSGKGRGSVPTAVSYFVTSYGVPVAWVTFDGATHYATDADIVAAAGVLTGAPEAQRRTMRKHRDAVRAVWPVAFAVEDHTAQGGDVNVTSRPAAV